MDRGSGSAHVRRGEAHQLAQRHVILAVPAVRVSVLAIADGEPDDAGTLTRVDQPLPTGGDGALGRQDRSSQDAGQKKDGEPHKDSGSGFRKLDRTRAPRVAGGLAATGTRAKPRSLRRSLKGNPPPCW